MNGEGLEDGTSHKEPACQCRKQERLREDALGKGMATLSSILAWRIPWTEEPGGLWSITLYEVFPHRKKDSCRMISFGL